MKHILYIIPIILFGCNFSSAEEHSFDHELMPPDSIHIRRSTEGHAPLLKSLLEQNDLKAFYQHAKTVLTAINKLQHDGVMTREEACDMIWSLYLIGGAPCMKLRITPVLNHGLIKTRKIMIFTAKQGSAQRFPLWI